MYWTGGVVYDRGFAEPPPPPPPPVHDCDCYSDCGPAHYTPPPPTYPAAQPYYPPPVMPAAAPEPPLPRFALGAFAGSLEVNDSARGTDLGLLARLRLTDSLLVEGEIAKTEMDSARIDRRIGGALMYDFAPRSRWSAHLLLGTGVTQVAISDDNWKAEQRYGEIGIGLSRKLTHRLKIAGDLRAGARSRVDDQPTDAMFKSIAPSTEAEEAYTRARLSLILSL